MRLGFNLIAASCLSVGWITANDRTEGAVLAQPRSVKTQSSSLPRIVYAKNQTPVLFLPDGQTREVRSLLNVQSPMQFGKYIWNESGIGAGPVWVRVDLARQTLSVFRAGHEIGSTVILFGADNKSTPTGVFPVLAKAERHRSTAYDANMPFMLRLTADGVAIHASDVREGAATHGCIGVPLDFARLLFGQVKVGDKVAIIGFKSTDVYQVNRAK